MAKATELTKDQEIERLKEQLACVEGIAVEAIGGLQAGDGWTYDLGWDLSRQLDDLLGRVHFGPDDDENDD
jgi:hypothetical protein